MILPEPGTSFEWRETTFGATLVCRPLATLATHLFTTRAWTLGQGRSAEAAGWSEVAAALGSPASLLRRARQVHGAAVLSADFDPDVPERLPEADIVIGRSTELTMAVQVADCVPLLMADRRTGAVAAVHAGWRGLVANVPGVAVAALSAQFGSRPEDLVAALGPSVGACCYEVGEEVRASFAAAGATDARLACWFRTAPVASPRNPPLAGVPTDGRPGRWYFDGWRAARDQLLGAGVPAGQIFSAELCTASHPGLFCSYRRDGIGAGRLAGAIRPSARRP